MKNLNIPFLALFYLLFTGITGCSLYKTNSDITFKSTQLYDNKPVIFVGNVKETADQLSLLGTVKATVTQPNLLSEDPTKEQADIVLAYKAKKLGADAVIHVEYKFLMAASMLQKVIATGQAVKLKKNPKTGISIDDKILSDEEVVEITNLPPTTAPKSPDPFSIEEQVIATPVTASAAQPLEAEIANLPTPMTPKGLDPFSIEEQVIATPTTAHEVLPIFLSTKTTPLPLTPAELKLQALEQKKETVASYKLMLTNANFIQKRADSLSDKEMAKAASRIIQYAEQFLAKAELEVQEMEEELQK